MWIWHLEKIPGSVTHCTYRMFLVSALLQIAEAKEFMKRRFVTKLASRNIAYKV